MDVECVVRGGRSVLKGTGFAQEAAACSWALRTSISFALGCCYNGAAGVTDRTPVPIFFDGVAAGFLLLLPHSCFLAFTFPSRYFLAQPLSALAIWVVVLPLSSAFLFDLFLPSCGPRFRFLLAGLVSPKYFRGL